MSGGEILMKLNTLPRITAVSFTLTCPIQSFRIFTMDFPGEVQRPSIFGSISTVNSFTGNENDTNMLKNMHTLGNSMENKYCKMKKLIAIIDSYMETRAEDQAILINQHLQALSLSLDLSIFDPHTNIAGNFFISIYNLMDILEPRSLTSWYCVDVLLNACKNSSAREALMKTYQFLPYLARIISDQLTREKKTRLLTLMQDITCGIKIHWHIPHMIHLMSILCKWIERQESDVIALSLGVLVNLCYKNLSSVYVLQRNVDLKKFIRICLALKEGPIVEAYVCQVMIILENVSGYVPTVVFPKFIDTTFTAVLEAYQKKDCIVLKQVTEFFMEYVKNNSAHLGSYDKSSERVENILDLIESSQNTSKDPECLSVILDFINFLIEVKAPQVTNQSLRIIPLALKWIQEITVSYHALAILRTVAVNVDKKENNILESLIVGLKAFLCILNSCKNEGIMVNTDYSKRLGALLQLLTAMIQVKAISHKVSQELREDIFTNIFFPLLGDDSPRSSENTCSIDSVNLYIYALDLVAKLVDCNNSWIGLLNNLLRNRQIHVIIAQAICHSPPDVRKIALELSGSCSDGVSAALTNLQSIMSAGIDTCSHICSPQPNELACSLIPAGQHERLHTLLENVENLIARNGVKDIATSELMELYDYKISYLSQAERAALASVEASAKHCTHLQHRITRLTYEHTRLHQAELHTIQKLEEITKKSDEQSTELTDLQNKFEAEKGRYKALHSQFVIKEKALKECEAALKDTESKFSKLQQLFNKVEETCRKHEKHVQKKEELLKNANETIENYNKQVKELEKCLTEKLKVLEETTSTLQIKTAILDNITRMANSQSLRN